MNPAEYLDAIHIASSSIVYCSIFLQAAANVESTAVGSLVVTVFIAAR